MTCSHEVRSFLRDLPKCEQHLHIEGTFEPALVFELAERNSIALDPKLFTTVEAAVEQYKHFTSLDHFLSYYNAAMAALVTESDFYALAEAYLKKVHNDGAVHAEIFVDPQVSSMISLARGHS